MKRAIHPQLPLTQAVEWLLRGGFKSATPGALLGELCNRLVAEGLPIANVTLGIASLDPLISATRLRWQPQGGRVIEEVMLHGMVSRVAAQDDALRLGFADTNHLIEWRSGNAIGFTAQEQAYLGAVCMAMAAPLEVVIGRSVTRNVLQAYLGRRSAEKVLNGTVRRGVGEVIEAVVWISDLRGFTLLSETLTSDQVITALNDCCARLVGAIQPFGGEVLKFIGDGLLAIFPLADHGEQAACDAAISAVRAARAGMARLDEERALAGLPPLPFGVALHRGAVMYGNIGAPDRLDFTAIGPAVNVASRIEELCRPLACPVLISEAVAARCTKDLIAAGTHSLRGVARPVALFTLPGLAAGQALNSR
ncbi:MAG TPA: adenylate/guanylate cyclase domain-containing protein [Candidatus Binataceae bacterium]